MLSNPRVAEAFSHALQKALETKGRMDRNMQTVLALLNLPSRSDLTRIMTKLEAINGSLTNLSMKVDRLLATHGPGPPRAPRPPRRTNRKRAAPSSEE